MAMKKKSYRVTENILNLTRINNNYHKLCQYNGNSFYISDSEKPGFKELTLFGDLYCYSEDDLNYLKKIDFSFSFWRCNN